MLLGAAVALTVAADQPLEDYLTASLLQLKKEMPAGIPDLDIPPMDPHPLPDLTEQGSNDLIEYSFVLSTVAAAGLSTFDPRTVSVVDNQLEVRLAFPALQISGDYESADVAIMDIVAVMSASLSVSDAGVASII